MKVIDLLNRIANGEIDYIHRVIYDNKLYEETTNTEEMSMFKSYYHREENGVEYTSLGRIFDINNLNDEIKIEEDKKIEKIDMFDNFTGYNWSNRELCEQLERNTIELNSKINEIIDYINEVEKC